MRPLAADRFEIIAGVRRWMAVKNNGSLTIAAVVHGDCDDAAADAIRFAENEHRRDPTALDTARALRRIKNLHGFTQAQVAEHVAINLTAVRRYLGLFTASDALLAAIEKEGVPMRLASELVLYEKDQGEISARKLIKRLGSSDLTVREVAALRKKKPASADKRAAVAADPWTPLRRRIGKLAASDPLVARAELEAALAALPPAEASK